MFALAVTLTLAALPPDLERAVLADCRAAQADCRIVKVEAVRVPAGCGDLAAWKVTLTSKTVQLVTRFRNSSDVQPLAWKTTGPPTPLATVSIDATFSFVNIAADWCAVRSELDSTTIDLEGQRQVTRELRAAWDNGVPMVVHSKTRVAFDGHGHVTVGATTRDAASSASF